MRRISLLFVLTLLALGGGTAAPGNSKAVGGATARAAVVNECADRCTREYLRCVPVCAANPCVVSCERVLRGCLDGCSLP